jgi:hypothetical protein
MKKKITILCVAFVLAFSLLGVSSPPAVYALAVSMESSFQVLNLSSTLDANIGITYYNQDGSLATMASPYSNPVSDVVAVGTSNTYYPIHAASGFNGSVIVSSDQPVAVISNLVVNTSAKGMASYVAFQHGANKIYLPLLMKGNANQTSTFNIQNTGSTAVDITIQFVKSPGSTFADITNITDTIQVGAAHTYDLASLTQFASATKWIGAATVSVTDTINDSIAGVVTTINTKYSDANQLASYNAFTDGSTTVLLPLIQENNSGNRTSINCQNIDPTNTIDVTATYTPGNGYAAKSSETKLSIPPNGLAVFIQDYTGSTKFVGSAQVTSSPSAKMVCVVNQQKPATGRYSAYEGFDPAAATSTVVLPLIQSRNGTAANGYVYTSINLATADGASHPITCDFKPAPGFTDPANATGSGASVVFSQMDIYGNGSKFIGGAVCTSDDASNIFAIVNHSRQNTPQAFRDVQSTYDGFNQ